MIPLKVLTKIQTYNIYTYNTCFLRFFNDFSSKNNQIAPQVTLLVTTYHLLLYSESYSIVQHNHKPQTTSITTTAKRDRRQPARGDGAVWACSSCQLTTESLHWVAFVFIAHVDLTEQPYFVSWMVSSSRTPDQGLEVFWCYCPYFFFALVSWWFQHEDSVLVGHLFAGTDWHEVWVILLKRQDAGATYVGCLAKRNSSKRDPKAIVLSFLCKLRSLRIMGPPCTGLTGKKLPRLC